MFHIKSIWLCAMCCTLLFGCGKKEQPASLAPQAQSDSTINGPQSMELRPLTHLIPNRPTHLAVDSLGTIYWLQESALGDDILFFSGQDDIPHLSTLTSLAIINASGAPPATMDKPAHGSGNIQSIAIDADDNVLFFFSGGIGNSTRVCLGEFNPRDQSIHILSGTQRLATQSKMGASIELAQGQIIKPIGTDTNQRLPYWLWLHHSDAAVFFRFDPRTNQPGQQIDLVSAFDHLSGTGPPPNLSAGSLTFSPAEDDGLLMVDHHAAALWRINDSGSAAKWMTLMGLPQDLSVPTAMPDQTALAFAPAGEPAVGFDGDGQSSINAHALKLQLPALLALTGDSVMPAVLNEDIHGPEDIDIPHLKLDQLIATGKPHEWIAYDQYSGVLMRVRLVPKN